MQTSRTAVLAIATAVLVLGCTSGPARATSPGTGEPSGATTPASSPTPSSSPSTAPGPGVWLPDWADARIPAEVVNRRPLPFCGIEEAPVPRPGEYIDATVRNCFWAARTDGREAEFASVQPTMEGGKVATIYRLSADGGVDLLYDATQDAFGSGGWSVTTCRALVAEPGDRLFGTDGCGEARPLGQPLQAN